MNRKVKRMRKHVVIILLALLCAIMLQPVKAETPIAFEEIPVYVVDDMREYDQTVGLSWKLNWNLDKSAGVTEQCYYAKFSLAEDSFVRIKLSTEDKQSFASDEYFRLYGNETMATPITDNNIGYGSGDDYLQLKAGTYYIKCGSKLSMWGTSKHTTKVMIGAVAEAKGVQIEQAVSADRKNATITVTQKFATKLGKVRWGEGQLTSLLYSGQDMGSTNSFTVNKNGWYTISLKTESSVAFNKDIEYYAYINVSGIGEGAKKGVTYQANNLKYKLVKKGFDGTGTVMVTGIVKQGASVTIPGMVTIKGQSYKVVKIGSKAFYKKSKLKKLTIQSPYITSVGKNAFKGINQRAVFKVPKKQYKAYKKLLTAKTGFAKKKMKLKK